MGFQRGLIWNKEEAAVKSTKLVSICNGQEERYVPVDSDGRGCGARGGIRVGEGAHVVALSIKKKIPRKGRIRKLLTWLSRHLVVDKSTGQIGLATWRVQFGL